MHDASGVASVSMRFRGERHSVLVCEDKGAIALAETAEPQAVLAYGLVDAAVTPTLVSQGWDALGLVPSLVRPLRLAYVARRMPWARTRNESAVPAGVTLPTRTYPKGVRDVSSLPADVRLTRLWDRFSVDVGQAVERTTKWLQFRVHDRIESGYRVLISEDGDRYAIRAMCVFITKPSPLGLVGYVVELLHDRSVTGMRAASQLLGLALDEMKRAGALSAHALSLPHSGSYPMLALHGFVRGPLPGGTKPSLVVRALAPSFQDAIAERTRWYVSCADMCDV
jgi:hypothetical protein